MSDSQKEMIRNACEVILNVTIDVVLENAKEDFNSDLESWGVFEERKRAKLITNTRLLEKRVVSGYEVLAKVLGEE